MHWKSINDLWINNAGAVGNDPAALLDAQYQQAHEEDPTISNNGQSRETTWLISTNSH
jgi:hypothetical protein